MKRLLLMAMMLLGFATSAMAKPVYLAADAQVDATPVNVGGKEYLRYSIRTCDSGDLWMSNVVNFCADKLREGCDENLPSGYTSTDGNTRTWDVPMEVIKRGQSGMNFAHDGDWFNTLWLGLPDSKVKVGPNLVCARSIKDENIAHSGGVYLLYVGPGAKYVPAPGELGIDGRPVIVPCDGGYSAIPKAPPVTKGGSKGVGGDNIKVTVKESVNTATQIKSPQAVNVSNGNGWTAGNQIIKHNKAPVYAPNRQRIIAPQFKNGSVNTKNKAPVYAPSKQTNIFNVYLNGHQGVDPRSDCTKCHNQSQIDEEARDQEAYELWKKDSELWRQQQLACQGSQTSAKCVEAKRKVAEARKASKGKPAPPKKVPNTYN